MKRLISVKLAGNGLILLMTLLLIMHGLILSGVLPFSMVWGGQLDDTSSMVKMEIIAVAVLALFIFITSVHMDYYRIPALKKAARIGMWIIFLYFLLNILGNLASMDATEKLIFTPVSIIMALFSLRLAVEK